MNRQVARKIVKERVALADMVKGFSQAMLTKLCEKEKDGWHGWRQIKNEAQFMRRLNEHVMKALDSGDYVDVANFAAFLWYIRKKIEAERAALRGRS